MLNYTGHRTWEKGALSGARGICTQGGGHVLTGCLKGTANSAHRGKYEGAHFKGRNYKRTFG